MAAIYLYGCCLSLPESQDHSVQFQWIAFTIPQDSLLTLEKEMLEYLTNRIDSMLRNYPSTGLVITGDFNRMKLRQLCRYFSLRKVVKAPTRGRNILDQILTIMPDLQDHVQHLPPLGRSDHQCLLIHPKVGTKMKSPPRGECVRFKTKLGGVDPGLQCPRR